MTKNIKLVRETMGQMYLDRDQMGDVTFLVQGQRIRAHRIVLATQSPKYKTQFYGSNPDERDEIPVPNVSAAEFNVFLQFFYKEMVDLTMKNIDAVLDLAKGSLADEFIETCVNFRNYQNNVKNFCGSYYVAILSDFEMLRVECDQRVTTNTMDVFASDDFLRCERDVLLQILKMNTLNCSEMDVFTACIAWAREQCKRNDTDDGKPENLRAALGDAVYQIRFSSFTAEEFAALHKSMEGFFTADEVDEISYMTAKFKDFKPQKFNATPRTKTPEESLGAHAPAPAPWQQEIELRSSKQRSLVETDVGHFEFSFSCVTPIQLHGIGLGIQFSEAELMNFPKTLSVRAVRDNDAANGFSPLMFVPMKCKVYTDPARADETLIVFEKPIERVIEFTCAIQPPFKRLDYEFDLDHSIRPQNMAITFRDGKWVTRICFDKYDA